LKNIQHYTLINSCKKKLNDKASFRVIIDGKLKSCYIEIMFLYKLLCILTAREIGHRGKILQSARRSSRQNKKAEESLDHAYAGQVRGLSTTHFFPTFLNQTHKLGHV